MFEQMAIDRITETENLTDSLEDDAAEWLINWGIAQAQKQIKDVQLADDAGEKIDAVMAVMRELSNIAAESKATDVTTIKANVETLITVYTTAFGAVHTLAPDDFDQLAKTIRDKTPQETIQYLLSFIAPSL